MKIKLELSENQSEYIKQRAQEIDAPFTVIVKAIIQEAMTGRVGAGSAGRPPKIDIQEGADFIITPAKLRDLRKADAVYKNMDLGVFQASFFLRDKETGKVKDKSYYPFNYPICDISEYKSLAPAVRRLIDKKLPLYFIGKTAEQIKAERDSVTFFKDKGGKGDPE